MKTKRDEVLELVQRFRKPLGLMDWEINVEFGALKHRADCEARPEYVECYLRFDLAKIKRHELPAFVLHEMSHCLVWRLAAAAERLAGDRAADLEMLRVEEESLVTALERVLLPLLMGGNGHGSGT